MKIFAILPLLLAGQALASGPVKCSKKVCNRWGKFCKNVPINDGKPCDDGNACTVHDECWDGKCSGKKRECAKSKNQCKKVICDPKTGCKEVNLANGTACDDGDKCTVHDQCWEGKCSGKAKQCGGTDSPCTDKKCNPSTGDCDIFNVDDVPCDDGIKCTKDDTCSGGKCSGTKVTCPATNDPCTAYECDELTGECKIVNINEGQSCSDGDKCTIHDVCVKGKCVGKPKQCGGTDSPCTDKMCNPSTGDCDLINVNEGESCSDGDKCTVHDVCEKGTCVGKPKQCGGTDSPCTDKMCNPSTGDCDIFNVDDVPCDDGINCTENDTCSGGKCSGTKVTCPATNDPCTAYECNELTGECKIVNINEGQSCSDGDKCTVHDVCVKGKCVGKPKQCGGTDSPCTDKMCNPATGDCDIFNVDDVPCNDGDLCTTKDTCSGGKCSGVDVDCGDTDSVCTDKVCNAKTGKCDVINVNDGGKCDDGFPCTVDDTCWDGKCSGKPKICGDTGNDCTKGVCNVKTGACDPVPTNEGRSCDDGSKCTVFDKCQGGKCIGREKRCPSTFNDCTEPICEPSSGQCKAVPVKNGTACDDKNLCTDNDKCWEGKCSGTDKVCKDDANPCTKAECLPYTGECKSKPANDGKSCDDGDKCTEHDVCTFGKCRGKPVYGCLAPKKHPYHLRA